MRHPRPKDPRLYWRGDVLWCRVPKRISTGCRDETAASLFADQQERRTVDPTYDAASRASLGGALMMLREDLVRRGRSEATRDKAAQKVAHFVKQWGLDLALVKVNAPLVTAYIDARKAAGVADLTIKDELGHLRQALKLARHAGIFHVDPTTVFPPFFGGNHKPRKRWLRPEEAPLLLRELEPHRAAHVAFFLGTGARLGEAARAERGDVDLVQGMVQIRGTKTAASEDAVPITAVTAGLIRYALANAPRDVLLLGRGKDRPTRATTLFLPWGNMLRDLAAACKRAGIAKVSPNDLRRTFGKWHRLAGVDVETVSLLLRHTTDTLAQTTYAKVRGDEVRLLVEPQVRNVPFIALPGDETAPAWVLEPAADVEWDAIVARRTEPFTVARAVRALTTEAA